MSYQYNIRILCKDRSAFGRFAIASDQVVNGSGGVSSRGR